MSDAPIVHDDGSPTPAEKLEKRQIYLYPSTWNILEGLKRALSHQDLDETLTTLVDIGTKMVQLTTPENRKVRMTSGERRETGHPCPRCNRKVVVYENEAMVQLGREFPPSGRKP